MYMDDIKPFAKNEKDSETLIQAERICRKVLGMEFGIEKCVMLIRKRRIPEGMQLPKQ